jgi:glutamate decarboxylase
VATRLAGEIAKLGPFRLLTDGGELPVFAFTLNDDVTAYSVFDVSAGLRENGWLVPAYTFPANRTDLAALRIVIRNGFSHDMADMLLADLGQLVTRLAKQPEPVRGREAAGFAHGAGSAPGTKDAR